MKKTALYIIFALFTVFILTFTRANAAQEVQVTIPEYKTVIADMDIYNPALQYPIINYKNITYIPMTSKLCARLGLAVGFDAAKGLYIAKHPDTEYFSYSDTEGFFGSTDFQNSYDIFYTACIPEYPIYINGIYINNFKEEYPLLNFRDITYLPLTYSLASDELGFLVEWSETEGFGLCGNGRRIYADIGKKDSDGVRIFVQLQQYISQKNTDGTIEYSSHIENRRYKLLFDSEQIIPLEGESTNDDYEKYTLPAECTEINIDNGYLCYNSERLTATNALTQFSKKYEFEDTTFIVTYAYTNNIPAPYTDHAEYIFVLDKKGIRMLPEWDTKNNLSKILPDGTGDYYLCSDSYSPTGASRWSNPFACVWRYTKDGDFHEIVVPDTNSTNIIGVYGTSLYVKAMYYNSDKSLAINATPPISAVSSGFYEIDTQTGKVKKLYAYISGKCFLANNGTPYCLADYGAEPRIINLKTREIIPF